MDNKSFDIAGVRCNHEDKYDYLSYFLLLLHQSASYSMSLKCVTERYKYLTTLLLNTIRCSAPDTQNQK